MKECEVISGFSNTWMTVPSGFWEAFLSPGKGIGSGTEGTYVTDSVII